MFFTNLFNPRLLREEPVLALPTGIFFVLLGFTSAVIIFPKDISIATVFFSSLFILPYVVKIFDYEEKEILEKAVKKRGKLPLWNRMWSVLPEAGRIKASEDRSHTIYFPRGRFYRRHLPLVRFYFYLFLGMSIAYLYLYGVTEPSQKPLVFSQQLDLIHPYTQGFFSRNTAFEEILLNNLTVAFVCLVISFFYGTGAIFILNFNASVAGVFFGGFFKAFYAMVKLVYDQKLWSMGVVKGGALKLYFVPFFFLPHTVLELSGFLLAAVAGGILSRTLPHEPSGTTRVFLKDSLSFFVIAMVLIIIAAYVEVTLPAMFI
ncbi:MAG: stage II sporulation protein M [Candidatus Altiarchaeota archaeon]